MDDQGYKVAAAYLLKHAKVKPLVGIICGSGLSGLSKGMTDTQVFPYSELPGFPEPTVGGHVGELVFGYLGGVPTVCMRGRFHFYENNPMSLVVMPVRAFRCIGVKVMIVTNAAGGVNPNWKIGDVMCIMDHIGMPCLVGSNPCFGHNDEALGPRFMPTSNVYNKEMQSYVVKAAKTLKYDFVRPSGCYAMVSGPTYESTTEVKFFRQVGADSVGMSTVPEIIAAHHCGIKVIGLSLITNIACMPGEDAPAASHAEVLEVANSRAGQVQTLVAQIVTDMKSDLATMPDLPKIDLTVTGSKRSSIAVGQGPLLAAVVAGIAIGTFLSTRILKGN